MYKEEKMRGKKPEENAMRSSRSIFPSLRAPSTCWLRLLLCLLHRHLLLVFIVFLFFFFLFFLSFSSSSSLRPASLSHDQERKASPFCLSSSLVSPAARLSPATMLSDTSVHWRQTSAPAQKIRDKLIDTRRT